MPSTHKSLLQNIRASAAQNVRVHQIALADRAGTCRLNLAEDDPIGGRASIGNRNDCVQNITVEVRQITLDEVLQGLPIRLIKLDIEGGELAALRGAVDILHGASKPVITFEWNRNTAAAFECQPESIGDYLRSLGYALFLATPHGLAPFEDRPNEPGWIPMLWALTAQHKQELEVGEV